MKRSLSWLTCESKTPNLNQSWRTVYCWTRTSRRPTWLWSRCKSKHRQTPRNWSLTVLRRWSVKRRRPYKKCNRLKTSLLIRSTQIRSCWRNYTSLNWTPSRRSRTQVTVSPPRSRRRTPSSRSYAHSETSSSTSSKAWRARTLRKRSLIGSLRS